MQLEKKLDSMKGKKYMIATFEHTFQNYEIVNDELIISTDKKIIRHPVKNAGKFLESFLPVDTALENTNSSHAVLLQSVQEDLPNLRKIVADNITKIQTDKSFIPQAQATNESINAIVNMLKLEMQVMKLKKMGQ